MKKKAKVSQEIDSLDKKILLALLKDARRNFSDIARDCKVSTPTIIQRYENMKKNGIIIGTTLLINPENSKKKNFMLSIDIKAQGGCEDSIIESIKELPDVLDCRRVIGKYDIHAAIRVNTLDEIDQILNGIKKIKGVLSIEITASIDELCFYPENTLKLPEGPTHG